MFRQQVTQISNCTCKIIPQKNQYVIFRSPQSISNKKSEFKEKLSLKTHSTSAQKKYGGAISSQKKSLKPKKINQNNKTCQNQTICNNFDSQKEACRSSQQVSKKNTYICKQNFKKALIQGNSKLKNNKHQFSQDEYLKRKQNIKIQKPNTRISKEIQQYCNDPLDFAMINVNLAHKNMSRPITQYQMKSNSTYYGKHQQNTSKFQHQICSPSNAFSKNIRPNNKQNTQIYQNVKGKNKQNESHNFNSTTNNFNFDKIKDYRNQTVFQREQQPSKKPLININLTTQIPQTFHESLQKFYPRLKNNDVCSVIPLVVEPKTSKQKTKPIQQYNFRHKEESDHKNKVSQSRIQFVRDNHNPSIVTNTNQSTIKQSKSFATTVTNSILPNYIQNASRLSNRPEENNFQDYFAGGKYQRNFQFNTNNNSNYSSAFTSNMNQNLTEKTFNKYQRTEINDKLKTFNDLISNQNQTQSVYEGQDQNQNEFSRVVMSYRNIFQKSGIVKPVHYRLLSECQYQNRHQTQIKQKNRQNYKKFCNENQKQKQKNYITNNFSTYQ